MVLVVVSKTSGDELLRENDWQGEIPRVGDVLELHCGHMERWKVDEVDWVFEDVAEGKHSDVPLKLLTVKASPWDAATGREADPMCECGHRESIHSPNGCTGRSHTCDCGGFKVKV